MKKNHVRAKLKNGEASIGSWLTLPDPIAAHLMARTGFDWLTVELEHTPVTMQTAAESFAIISACGTAPLARVPWNSVENIKRVLDTGAWGIVVPMVNSRAEAEAVVAAARYASFMGLYLPVLKLPIRPAGGCRAVPPLASSLPARTRPRTIS